MERRWWWIAVIALVPVVLVTGILAGILLDREVLLDHAPVEGVPADAVDEFELMAEAWNLIDRVYVDQDALEPPGRAYGAISGMVNGLGDTGHSRFLDPEMVQAQLLVTQGEYEGIGAYVEMRDGLVIIVAPIDGSPAQSAGLQPGDVIVEVDGENVAGLPLDEVIARIVGPAGTGVSLTVLDPVTGVANEVDIVRDTVKIRDVTWARLPGTTVDLVRIARFSNGVTDDLLRALEAAQQDGATGLILDLRSNPGGLFGEAVGVASQFLPDGNVLLERDGEGTVTPIPVEPGGAATDIPLVVLIDEGSASASEIVAGALQDSERATLVGETTFGTGTVLQEFPLSDGSALLLAIKEWLTPSGRVIWRQGLAPDVEVVSPLNMARLLPAAAGDMTPEQLSASGDDQLLRALDLLQ